MGSALFLFAYTAVMVLSLRIPGQMVLWLTLSVILVSAAYLLGVWYPVLFTRAACGIRFCSPVRRGFWDTGGCFCRCLC